jgi:rhodanese-related sulfurtransferase
MLARILMSLAIQILRICTVSLAIGLILWTIRGVPRAQSAPTTTAVCSAPEAVLAAAVWIEQDAAHALMSDSGAVFVDCRSAPEFQSGHIATALSVPSDQPELTGPVTRLLGAARTIVAYCDAHSGCESSHRLAARLRELGYQDVRILRDGLPGWLERGFPAESGPCRVCEER